VVLGFPLSCTTNVAKLLQQTRKRFYENGDPTFLGYVYYGDPLFQLVGRTTKKWMPEKNWNIPWAIAF
jgi:hypothetical protein